MLHQEMHAFPDALLCLETHAFPKASLHLETHAFPDACIGLIDAHSSHFVSPPTGV
jgi:hypothetical protein